MRKLACFFAVMALVFAAVAPGWCEEKKGPFAYVPVMDYRFDPVPEGAMVNHTFAIHNRGDALLKIEQVKTS